MSKSSSDNEDIQNLPLPDLPLQGDVPLKYGNQFMYDVSTFLR